VELGGKDAAIVLRDCNLERTAAGLAYASMFNCGQDCSSVERIYVEEAIADRFVETLARALGRLRISPEPGAEVAPLQNEAQLAKVMAHVEDAIAKGAKAVVGGERTGQGLGYRPTLLDHCTRDMHVVTEETFGPVVAVVRVQDAEEAIRAANDSPYGLNGSVWTTDLARGEAIARRLDVGIAHVNGHSWTGASCPDVPWTGVKMTGPGIAGSRHAFHTFARPRTVMIDANKAPEPYWFPYDADYDAFTRALVRRAQGSKTVLFELLGLLGKRVKAVKSLVE
jgi:acyl-CoA reductase-like NAD-dependent aldehyde dehydrogenase